jgi:omega-3 fatty acid desaturase (delta-15 desaturase)
MLHCLLLRVTLPVACCWLLQDGSYDLSAPPPFGLADIRNAIPAHCWVKDTKRSMGFLALDVAIVGALAYGAFTLNAW